MRTSVSPRPSMVRLWLLRSIRPRGVLVTVLNSDCLASPLGPGSTGGHRQRNARWERAKSPVYDSIVTVHKQLSELGGESVAVAG